MQEGGDIHGIIVPWRPFRELSSFRKEMDRLWNEFFGETPFARKFTEEWSPYADISETKDVNVSVSGDLLTIKGEKEKEEKSEHYHCVERRYGSFQRSFRLPTSVQGDKVEATFDKGVLKVTLPKVEEAKKKETEVKVK